MAEQRGRQAEPLAHPQRVAARPAVRGVAERDELEQLVDPGFEGTLTLEITNLTRIPIVLWPRKPIAQLSFMTLDRPAERPYGHPDLGSHYHGQVDATESRYGAPASRPAGE